MQATAPSPDRSRSLQNTHAPIQAGTTYRISQGDTLSTIAARIDGRLPDTTWAVAEQIFASNPDAFIRNNPDLIKLGSLIQIPGVAELASSSSASASQPDPTVRTCAANSGTCTAGAGSRPAKCRHATVGIVGGDEYASGIGFGIGSGRC